MLRLLTCVIGAGVFCAPIAQAQPDGGEPHTSTHVDQPPCASTADLSQLSGTIVYEGDPIDGVDPERGFDVWIIGAPAWTSRLVAGGPGFDGHPAWSPDGRQIVYSAHGQRDPDLYLVDPDGANRKRLTFGQENEDYPIWFPEGIVYSAAKGRRIVDPVSGMTRPFTSTDSTVSHFTRSPDQSRMVVAKTSPRHVAEHHLYLTDADGIPIRQLTNVDSQEIHPFWSPVNNQIVYSGGDGRRDGKWDVYLLDLDTGDRKQLTQNPGADWACGWSPDGQWVLMASEYGQNWDIYAIRTDGSDLIRITCHAGNVRYASWTAAETLSKN